MGAVKVRLTHFTPAYASLSPIGKGCSGASLRSRAWYITLHVLSDGVYRPVIDCEDCELQVNAEHFQDEVI